MNQTAELLHHNAVVSELLPSIAKIKNFLQNDWPHLASSLWNKLGSMEQKTLRRPSQAGGLFTEEEHKQLQHPKRKSA